MRRTFRYDHNCARQFSSYLCLYILRMMDDRACFLALTSDVKYKDSSVSVEVFMELV